MKLIENWTTHLWKAWSIRLAMIAGLVGGYLAANPETTQALLALLPDGPARTLAGAGIGLLIFALPTVARLARQKPARKKEPTE